MNEYDLAEQIAVFNSEVLSLAEVSDFEQSLPAAFVDHATQLLVEAGEMSAPTIGITSRRTMEIAGVDWDDERRILTCIGSFFSTAPAKLELTQGEMFAALERLHSFVLAAAEGLDSEMLPSDPGRDLALTILETLRNAERLNLVIITNLAFDGEVPQLERIGAVATHVRVWDVNDLVALSGDDVRRQTIDVDVLAFSADGLDAIGPFGPEEDYSAYLIVLSGDMLADMYKEFGPRLLELNVRSFLQARNRVNKGIQSTLATEPHRFLAYNNGLSLTAAAVERTIVNGRMVITAVQDLQIVNGGQTTASLYHAKYRQKADLAQVRVQAKLTVVADQEKQELAPKISLYANSQNPVRMADFSANDPFHVELQRLSRDLLAPAAGTKGRESRWFYERSRGQYADLASAAGTPARIAAFKAENPARQKFMKTDVAKLDLLWDQRPHVVALGGEKYFGQFMQMLRERPSQVLPDAVYFQHLIAKAILWRATDTTVARLNLGGYKSQTVAYTMALLSKKTAQRIDLDDVWNKQLPPGEWLDAVAELAPLVNSGLVASAGNRNISEWAKKADCWEAIQQIEWEAPSALISERRPNSRSVSAASKTDSSLPASLLEIEARLEVVSFGSAGWFELSAWAKDTNNLAPWQRGIAFSLGRLVSQGKEPSEKQAIQGAKILAESNRLGFRPAV